MSININISQADKDKTKTKNDNLIIAIKALKYEDVPQFVQDNKVDDILIALIRMAKEV